MKLTAFKERDHKKIGVVIFTVVSILLLAGIFLYNSYAVYEDIKNFTVINGSTQDPGDIYFSYHLSSDNSYLTSPPAKSSGLTLDASHSVCNNGATVTWDNDTWSAIINLNNYSNASGQRIKCDLWFESNPAGATLAKLKALDSTLKLNESMNSDPGTCPAYDADAKTINVGPPEEDASLLCEAEDDYGTTYYYRGNVTNNYVSFAGFTWRIVRINGDGSIRMIYDGTTPYRNIKEGGSEYGGASRQIGTSDFNSSYNDNAYVGYMYRAIGQSSYANTFDVMNNKNANSSTIKGDANTPGSIDYWYAHNIDITISGTSKKYSDYVSLDTIFCNDKNIAENYINNASYNKGYAQNETYFSWYSRTTLKTRFTCVNTQGTVDSKNDAFTVSDKGNGALTYPVALLTTDEFVAAGGGDYYPPTSHYLRTGSSYWTMSPFWYDSRDNSVSFKGVDSWGHTCRVDTRYSGVGVRPVLSLLPGTGFASGDGTYEHPYVVDVI